MSLAQGLSEMCILNTFIVSPIVVILCIQDRNLGE